MLDKAIRINDKISGYLESRGWGTREMKREFEKAQGEIERIQVDAIRRQIHILLRLRGEAHMWSEQERTARERQRAAAEQRKIEKAIEDLNALLPLEDRMAFTDNWQIIYRY